MTLTGSPPAPVATRRWPIVMVVVIVLGALLAGYFLWWSRPTAFGGWSSEVGGPVQVGQTLNVDMGSVVGETVSLHGARAVVVRNSADATIEFVVCRYKGEERVGAVVGPLSDYCSTVSPLHGHRLPALSHDSNESIIVRIAPRASGRLVLDGMSVSYTRGWKHLWQTGKEQAGVGIDVTVP